MQQSCAGNCGVIRHPVMGYELKITRRDFHSDDGNEITAEEWLSVVSDDSELQLRIENGKYFVVYLNGWFDWFEGCIVTKNPDNHILEKMLAIAKILNAKVQGDDGEVYRIPDINSGEVEGLEEREVITKDIFWYIGGLNDFWRKLLKK
jgi:hypothetical protein